ncbi:hypothetical protein ACVXHB_08530 [Escherichia coli]
MLELEPFDRELFGGIVVGVTAKERRMGGDHPLREAAGKSGASVCRSGIVPASSPLGERREQASNFLPC